MAPTVLPTHHRASCGATTALVEAALLTGAAEGRVEIGTILSAPEAHLNEAALARIASNELP